MPCVRCYVIVSFFARGTGGGSGPTDYLLGRDRNREKAELLRGDAEETKALIDASPYSKTYTSGVLSFEERNIPDAMKREVMDSFEECLFPGLDKNQYNVLWVEHTDKGRLELNFVIPNVELTSGKRLQPYYHSADLPRVDAWQTIKNIEYGFTDPNDPAKRQTLVIAKDLPKHKEEAAKALDDGLMALAGQGLIKSREDVINALQNAGFEIGRQTKTSISIKDPDGGRNIRLKGALYEQDFRLSQDLQRDIQERSRQYQNSGTERLAEARNRYSTGIERKRQQLEKRYPRQTASLQTGIAREPKAHELGSVPLVDLVNGLAVDSGRRADSLERMAGLDDQRAEPEHISRQNSLAGLAGGAGVYERKRYPVHHPEQEKSDKTNDSPDEIRGMGHSNREISNDGSRENLTQYIEKHRERQAESRERQGRLRQERNGQVSEIGRAGRPVGEIDRTIRLVDRAKQGIDRAITAVHDFAKTIKEKVKEVRNSFGFER